MANVHLLSHNVSDDYQGDVVCAGCNYVAADAGDLIQHVGRHGAKLRDRKLCRLCTTFVVNMEQHVQMKHKEQYRRYEAGLTVSCDQCEKRFRTRAHAVNHKHIAHTSLQALSCLICAKQFASSSLLQLHIKKEHGKVLTCVVCQKTYSKYCLLYTHAKTHKEVHICKTCGSVFRCKQSLDQHEYGHRADYSFKCDLCGKTFKRPTNLMQHKMVVHTDKVRKKRKAHARKCAEREWSASTNVRDKGCDTKSSRSNARNAGSAGCCWAICSSISGRNIPMPLQLFKVARNSLSAFFSTGSVSWRLIDLFDFS
ncbi:zinc finger protein 22-like [Paramacrobiotus metropolitanus]|uniref:zinc finger protein 22-like n=1 Tax=Paramacrobiotus metropolitanus TaxID=2943436 RepID=UPI002445C67F|nr:zinc finger protein 22-like [Paramacrobiotus metropolitanus]